MEQLVAQAMLVHQVAELADRGLIPQKLPIEIDADGASTCPCRLASCSSLRFYPKVRHSVWEAKPACVVYKTLAKIAVRSQ